MTRLLLVEDDSRLRAGLVADLREAGYAPAAVGSAEEAWATLDADGAPDVMLLDIRLPGESGLDLVRRLTAEGRLPPTVALSGEASIGETVEALRLGVHDFLEKPFRPERLLRSIENALEHRSLRRQVDALRRELEDGGELLGESAAMAELRKKIVRAAPTEARVLLLGESGTGKELVAGALHRASRRCAGPFVRINCAAIPATLIEDELFGHVPGAFTDARGSKAGLFEEADGGTLFLDEIGDMEPQLQGRLLRVLEDGAVRRLGETRPRSVDVRVLAATNRDLEAAVAEGSFREDLYFRLAHLPIEVPSLRQREGDVRLLFHHFLDTFHRRHRSRPRRVEEAVLEVLERHRWPGNVRELKHLAERLAIFGGDPITVEDLPSAVLRGDASSWLRLPAQFEVLPLREFREHCEREYVESVLRRCGWNFTDAARRLGLNRTYLHDKAKDLGIRRPGSGA